MVKKVGHYKANRNVFKIMIIMGVIVTLVVTNVLFTMATGKHFRSGKDALLYKSGSGFYREKVIANRGYIYDRNKEIIAQDIEAFDLYAVVDKKRVNATDKPAHIVNYKKTCEALAPILNVSADKLRPFLENASKEGIFQTEFGAYGKTLTAQQREDIIKLDLPGLEFTKSTDRVYPTNDFASQLIGYAQYNYDDKKISGVMGFEKNFDEELSGKDGEVTYQTDSDGNYLPKTKKFTKTAENGEDIYLTIDKNVQITLEKALSDTMNSNKANKAWGIAMEAKTGKVLAQAGYPSFDLNKREEITNYINIPSEMPFEPGSVMKPFVYAGAMQEGVYNGEYLFNSGNLSVGLDENGNFILVNPDNPNKLGTVGDALGKNYGTISLDEGLIRSTNTAIVALLTKLYDSNKNIEYLKNLGFFNKIDMYGVNENNGVLNVNDPFSKIALGFGQGSSINSYQLVRAASSIFGDGNRVEPYIVDHIVNPNTGKTTYLGKTKKTATGIDENTAKSVQALLKRVVDEPYGTARHYQMSDVTIMAKTGTGQIAVPGGYSSEIYTTSVLAAAPAEDPQVIIYYAFESSNILYYNVSYFQDVVREALVAIKGYGDSSQQTTNNTLSASFNEFVMPSLVNHNLDYVKSKLDPQTSNYIVIGDGNSIVSQYPYANDETLSNQRIFLLSDGANKTMPNMSGWSRKDVKMFEKLCGIKIKMKGSGLVTTQNVPASTAIQVGSDISVTLK